MDIMNRPRLQPSISPVAPSTPAPAPQVPAHEERLIDQYDVDGALEHAQRVLPDHELTHTVQAAEAEGRRAGWGEAGRWLFGVIAVGLIAVVGLRDIRFLPIALLLITMFAIPIMLAGVWTVHDRTERDAVMDHLHARAGHGPTPTPGPVPADEGPLPDHRDLPPTRPRPAIRHDPRL
jgi:hypothetical protein